MSMEKRGWRKTGVVILNQDQQHQTPGQATLYSEADLHHTPNVTLVMPRTMSMEVVSGFMEPTSLQPTTGGSQRDTGWPNITASHSIPPTPARGMR